MIKYFFSNERDYSYLFKGLKIEKDPVALEHMNKYPVIHIIFKDAKTNSWKETYERFEAKSERESGFGRYDVVIIDRETPRAMIMEFKVSEEEDLAKDALKALEQIENKKYDADLKDRGINNIVKAGIALKGKMCSCRVV